MRFSLVDMRKAVRAVAIGVGLAVAIPLALSAVFMAIHMICNVFGISDMGIWFYGSPSGLNWGLNFFNLGGLELNGPDGISFFPYM
jgi:hypothetical protein